MRSKRPFILTAAVLFLALLACFGRLGISSPPSPALDEIAGSYYKGDGLGGA